MSLAPLGNLPETQAQEFEKDARRREKELKTSALQFASQILMDRGRREWIVPREFLEDIMRGANVSRYIAQFVLDDLRSKGELVFILGKGVRSKSVDVSFMDSDRNALLPDRVFNRH
jgi:hypothetical protein